MLANLKIQQRLLLALVLPVALLIGLAGYDITIKWETRQEMANLVPLARDVANLSRLVHELQRERGTSAILLGSKGGQMRAELGDQRRRTDAERAAAVASLERLGQMARGNLKDTAGKAGAIMNELNAKRNEIDALGISVASSSAFYTQMIARILDVAGAIGEATHDGDVSAAVATYVNFIQGKERAGQERAQVGAGLSAGRFDLAMYNKAVGLASAQDVYFGAFQSAITQGQREFYQRAVSGTAIDTVLKMRQIVMEGGLSGDLKGLDGKTWFDAATVRIELLKTVEAYLAGDLLDLAAVKRSDATLQLSALAAFVVLALLSSFVAALVMTRSITRPLDALARIMKQLADGDTATAIEGADRGDEIGQMAQAVAFFRSNMIEARDLASKETETVNERVARAARVSDLTAQFDADIAGTLGFVSAALLELRTTATMMSATAEETDREASGVASAAADATGNVQSISAAAEEMSGSIDEIGRQVVQSANIARKAVEEATRTNQTVLGLSEAAEKIGNVVKLISDIAGQTNLLALNATIEAARAGEVGRGFAVVAAEVKTLADQTGKATGEITAQISAIQQTSIDTVKAIQGINATIAQMDEIASSIASAVEEQSAATQEIARNVQNAATGTQGISAGISGVTQATQRTGSASRQVLSSSEELSAQSEAMRARVEQFLGNIRTA